MAGFPLELPAGAGSVRRRIVGRGRGSGLGKTCGKGHKGQKSRSGGKVRPGFEGGQMPLYRRLPKRGFSNARFALSVNIVNLEQLAHCYSDGDEVSFKTLVQHRLVSKRAKNVKILGNGELNIRLMVRVIMVSAGARTKILQAGGSIEPLDKAEGN